MRRVYLVLAMLALVVISALPATAQSWGNNDWGQDDNSRWDGGNNWEHDDDNNRWDDDDNNRWDDDDNNRWDNNNVWCGWFPGWWGSWSYWCYSPFFGWWELF
jgi:hypothetical protein